MNSLWIVALAALGTAPFDKSVGDGTLIFLENCNSVVEYSTKGKIGHVALVFHDGGETYFYEATPGKVRRVTADEYFVELARLNKRRDADDQIRVWMLRPRTAYTANQAGAMRTFLDAQIGRRYSLRNYVLKEKSDGKHDAELGPLKIEIAVGGHQPTEGIHCAELASTTLVESGRYDFTNCHKINPHALYTAVLPTHHAPEEVAVPPLAVKESWCVRAQRLWSEAWTWCGWSCGEAWAFCR
jgi:hypothetical protein